MRALIMQNTNCDNSTGIKPVLLEHDYCRHNCMPDVEDSEKNVYGKKLKQRFDVVHKWTDRLLVRVTTEGNWTKIIDREVAILKVQYPFLPQQQLRGKAYKKFEIPAVMGGIVCRTSALLLEGASPKELPKAHKNSDRKMSSSENVRKLDSPGSLSDSSMRRFQTVMGHPTGRTIGMNSEDTPGIETITSTKKNSANSDETETPTPEFEFPDTNKQLSNNSMLTQRFDPNYQSRNSDDELTIHSAPTQFVTPNFQLLNNETVINDDLLDIANDVGLGQSVSLYILPPACRQIVSRATIPSQLKAKKSSLYVDVNSNFVTREVSSRRGETNLSTTSSTSSSFTKKSSRDEEVMPIFDTVDIDDLTQLPTPEVAHFRLSLSSNSSTPGAMSLDHSHGSYRSILKLQQSQDLHKNITSKTVDYKPVKIVTVEYDLKRKTSRRETSSSENKENCTATKHFHEERPRLEKSALTRYSKSVLKSPILNDTLSLVWRTERLDLNESHSKKERSASPESTSPGRKKRRLESHDRGSMHFMPIYRSNKKRKIEMVDLTQADETRSVPEDIVVHKINKSSTAEPLAIRSTSPKKKMRRLESRDRASMNSMPIYRSNKKRKIEIVDLTQEVDGTSGQKDFVVHKIAKSSTTEPLVIQENNQQVPSLLKVVEMKFINSSFVETFRVEIEKNDARSKKVALGSPRSVLVNDQQEKCSSNSATAKESLAIVNNDGYHSNNIADSSVNNLIDQRKENESLKLVVDGKFAIASDCGHNSELTAKSSASVLIDDRQQKSSQTSSSAHLTGTTATESELLSNRCCEYDQNFLNENLSFIEPIEYFTFDTSFENRFKVHTSVINEQVGEILKFLKADLEVTSCS